MGVVTGRNRLHQFTAGILLRGLQEQPENDELAAAMTGAFGSAGSFTDFCRNDSGIRQLTVIEINPAKNLSPFLQALPKHALHSFPQLDMQRMSFADSSIDIIIHSDTLEHVP